MNTIVKSSALKILEEYLTRSSHTGSRYKQIINKQFVLTWQILNRIFTIIKESYFSKDEKEQLKEILEHLFITALPYFLQGMDSNPIHHNVRTVENILHITIQEHESFKFIMNAAVLALFHDIGNGLVHPYLKKIKDSDIGRRILKLKTKKQPERKREINQLTRQAKDFRNAHMKEGAKITKILLKQFISKKRNKIFTYQDIKKIKECIKIHDLPSVTWYNARLGIHYSDSDLLPLTNKLAVVLREADRLWMVTDDGLKKDLLDDVKNDTGKAQDPLVKLKHNIQRFKDEYELYLPVYESDSVVMTGFKGKTLFQTVSGFQLFIRFVYERLKEILGKNYKITIAISLGGTKLGIAIVFPAGILVEIVPPFNWRTSFTIDDQEMYADKLRCQILEVLKPVIDMVDNTLGQNHSETIGISCKGPLSLVNGIKILGEGKKLTTLPFKDFPLEDKIKESLENYYLSRTFKVTLIHDGSAAILGETGPEGTLKGEKDAAAIIIGSGIGIGIIENKVIVYEDLSSLGRYLIYVNEGENSYHYEFMAKKTKKGLEPYRDLNKLSEKYKGKATHLTQRIAGPWLAERLAEILIAPENTKFLKELKKASKNKVNKAAVLAYLANKDTHKDMEKVLLINLTEAAKKGSAKARNFIIATSEELGLALSEFIYNYRNNSFIMHIVLVSSVAENFGKGVAGEDGKDLFISRIREKVKQNLLKRKNISPGKVREIAEGIIRSDISVEREFLAFTPQ